MLTTIVPLIFFLICVLMVFVLPGVLLHAYLHRRRTGKFPKWLESIPEEERKQIAPYLTYFAVACIAGVLLGMPAAWEQQPALGVYFSAYVGCLLTFIAISSPREKFSIKLLAQIVFLGLVILHLAYPYILGVALVEGWDMLRQQYARPVAALLAALGIMVALGLHMVVTLLALFFRQPSAR